MSAITDPQLSPYFLKSGSLSSHGRILAILESLSKDVCILDVGTATGYLGANLRQRGYHHVIGIEQNHEWASMAQPFYEKVEPLDIEQDAFPWPESFFDAIVCADVLEHVRAPEKILRRLLPMVKPRGLMIFSLPNTAHWSMRMSLLFGRFDYVEKGILDRGHLRFFTLMSASRMLRGAGLRIERIIATPLPIAHWCSTRPRFSLLWRLLERLDGCFGLLFPTLFAYQFVFVARVAAEGRREAQ